MHEKYLDIYIEASAEKKRKVKDVLTNLSAQYDIAIRNAGEICQNNIVEDDGAILWRCGSVTDQKLTNLLTKAVGIFNFEHLVPDLEFGRPDIVGYDPKTCFLDEILQEMARYLGFTPERSGSAQKCVVQITHDVDNPQLLTKYQLARSLALLLRGQSNELHTLKAAVSSIILKKPDPFWCFDKIKALGETHGFKSTYFVFADYEKQHPRDPRYRLSTPRYKKKFEDLHNDGNEIGFHSGILYNQFDVPRGRLVGDPVNSHRAHYWSVPVSNLEEYFDLMAKSGIRSDASFSPRKNGFMMGSTYPLSFTTESGLKLILFPSQFMDAYVKTDEETAPILDQAFSGGNINHAPIINLNWHVRVFSEVGCWRGYTKAFEDLLAAIDERAEIEFETMDQTYARWKLIFDAADL
jgi:hypothetical protein